MDLLPLRSAIGSSMSEFDIFGRFAAKVDTSGASGVFCRDRLL